MGYQAQDYSFDCLSSPFTEYNQNCFACLQRLNRDPVHELDFLHFGEFIAYCDVRNACPVQSYPCSPLPSLSTRTTVCADMICRPRYWARWRRDLLPGQ
jgi:hypothetical protein